MTTRQIEHRFAVEHASRTIRRLAQPRTRDAGSAWIVILCVAGALGAFVLGLVMGVGR